MQYYIVVSIVELGRAIGFIRLHRHMIFTSKCKSHLNVQQIYFWELFLSCSTDVVIALVSFCSLTRILSNKFWGWDSIGPNFLNLFKIEYKMMYVHFMVFNFMLHLAVYLTAFPLGYRCILSLVRQPISCLQRLSRRGISGDRGMFYHAKLLQLLFWWICKAITCTCLYTPFTLNLSPFGG